MTVDHLYYTASGTELVRRLAESGDRLFTAARARELAPSAGISPGYLLPALHHLAKAGWIVRLRKGLYALSFSVPGVPPVHEFEVAMYLVHPAVISHWSALSYHGLTDQIPRRVFVTTTARSIPRPRGERKEPPDRGYLAGGSIYQFIQIKPERFFGTSDIWVGEARVKMTDPERTLLDGLIAPGYCGDFGEVLHAFELRGKNLDVDRLISYAVKLDASTAKRLGWVLEHQGMDPAKLERLRSVPIKGYRGLDPTGPRRGLCDVRWMIQVNLPGNLVR